jgi:hypothetical protein
MPTTQQNTGETPETKAAREALEKQQLAAKANEDAERGDRVGRNDTRTAHDRAMAEIDANQRAALDRGELDDIHRTSPNDDPEWQSDPKATKMDFLVRSPIKGKVQGRYLRLGTNVTLELTRDIRDLVRPGVLEAIGTHDRS